MVGEALNRTVEMGRTVFVRLRFKKNKKKGKENAGFYAEAALELRLTFPLAMSARIQTLNMGLV